MIFIVYANLLYVCIYKVHAYLIKAYAMMQV